MTIARRLLILLTVPLVALVGAASASIAAQLVFFGLNASLTCLLIDL